MLKIAKEIFEKHGKLSTFLLARRLKISISHAKKLIDMFEAEKATKA